MSKGQGSNEKSMEQEDVDLYVIFRLFLLNWKLVIAVTLLGWSSGWVVSRFLITPTYKATAVIMAGSDGANVTGSIRSVLTSSPLGALMGISGGSDALAKYVEYLNSRALTSKVVDDKNLLSVFHLDGGAPSELDLRKRREGLIASLIDQVKVEPVQGASIIRIEYKNTDPEIAKKIVDYYLEYLQEFVSGGMLTQAKRTENFIRDRLKESRDKLSVVEEKFISLQKSKGVIQLPSQLGMSLNTASQFRAQLIQKEMEIELYKNIMKDSSEVKRLEAERDQLQSQLDKLVQGGERAASSKKRSGKIEVFTPLAQGPSLEMEFSAAEREYLTQVKLVELLQQQLELSQIETRRQEPTFQVIDPPIAPTLPFSPNYRMNQALGALISLFACTIFLLVVNHSARAANRMRKFVKTSKPYLAIAQ